MESPESVADSLKTAKSEPAAGGLLGDLTLVTSHSDAPQTSLPYTNSTVKSEDCAGKGLEKNCETAGDLAQDPNVIGWDGDDDPQNPYNWSSSKKLTTVFLVSALTFVTPLASSMFAPSVPELLEEFGSTSRTLASFCVSVYVFGYAAGPMVFAPLSEIYGRSWIYHGTNLGFIVFLIACALAPNLSSFIAFRFLSGLFGACPVANGGGTIADCVPQEKRGTAMAGFSVGPLLGPIIGPVVGGFVGNAIGWRWVFWILAILESVLAILFFILSRETYAPILLQRKVDRLRKETGNMLLRSKLDSGLSPRDHFARGIVRPLKMTFLSPICIVAAAYIALVYGYLYLLFSSITPVFKQLYGFSTIGAGLSFLGIGIGSMIGVIFFSFYSDRSMKKKAMAQDALAVADDRTPEGMKPEYRLPPLKVAGFFLPVGMFIYGWTTEKQVHWIVPILATGVMGLGNIVAFMALQMYLVDTFTLYAASAIASNTLVRSIMGAVLPLAALPMYDTLGLGWGNSLLGFVATLLLPVPWYLIKYGEYLRTKFVIKNL